MTGVQTCALPIWISLTELVLKALTTVGDKELKALIKKDLEERASRGRPQQSKPKTTD